jgi:phosphoenolpyruvate carboxykinase (GTP)
VLNRVHGEVGAAETPIGYLPHLSGIDVTGLDVSAGTLKELLDVDKKEWAEAVPGQKEYFLKYGDRMPKELWQECEALEKRLQS